MKGGEKPEMKKLGFAGVIIFAALASCSLTLIASGLDLLPNVNDAKTVSLQVSAGIGDVDGNVDITLGYDLQVSFGNYSRMINMQGIVASEIEGNAKDVTLLEIEFDADALLSPTEHQDAPDEPQLSPYIAYDDDEPYIAYETEEATSHTMPDGGPNPMPDTIIEPFIPDNNTGGFNQTKPSPRENPFAAEDQSYLEPEDRYMGMDT